MIESFLNNLAWGFGSLSIIASIMRSAKGMAFNNIELSMIVVSISWLLR